MKYIVEITSAAMTYIRSFIQIGSCIQQLLWGAHTGTEIIRLSHKPTFIFSKKGKAAKNDNVAHQESRSATKSCAIKILSDN
jgi:hypothetical protein